MDRALDDRGDGIGAAARAFDEAMRDAVLPFWAAEGADPAGGLYWERLDLAGRPVRSVPRRLMVQARQAATFADAARTGRCSPAAGEAALDIFDRTLALFSDEGDLARGLAFSAGRGGRIVDGTRDAYAHAFALFALAAVLRLAGEARHRRAVERLLGFVDAALVDPEAGGLVGRHPHPPPGKAQNPTMHLLEAYLALHEAWPERGFLDRAGALVRLAERRLFREPPGAVLEHYAQDWGPGPDAAADHFEPGHQFEWAWLVDRHAALAGAGPRPLAGRLWDAGARHGFDAAGFIVDAVGTDLAPLGGSRRLWPHCEAVRAALAAPGRAGAPGVLARALARLGRDFLGRPFAAGWTDRLDERGAPAVDGVPASSLYHLYGAWAEVELRAPRGRAGQPLADLVAGQSTSRLVSRMAGAAGADRSEA